LNLGPVAQLDRASDYGSEGWGFESLRAHVNEGIEDILGSIAQLDRAPDFGSGGWGFDSLWAHVIHRISGFFVLTLALTAPGCGIPPSLTPILHPTDCRAELPTHTVAWFAPADSGDRATLNRWCRAVGKPVIIPSPYLFREHPIDSIVVVSWNTHVGGGNLVGFVDSLRAGLLTHGAPVTDFVLLLQEVYREGAVPTPPPANSRGTRRIAPHPDDWTRQDIVILADSLGLSLFYAPSMRNGWGSTASAAEDRGSAILSTLPLFDFKIYEVAFEILRRVTPSARIRGTTSTGHPWSLTLASVHLDVIRVRPAMWRDFGYGRGRQGYGLALALEAEPAMLIGGDFNVMTADEWVMRIMRDRFCLPAGSDSRFSVVMLGIPLFRPDYLLARLPPPYRMAPYRRLDSDFGSDHNPVMTTVHLTASDSSTPYKCSRPGRVLPPGPRQ
jgi:hypothetical protein